jgi:hypothetical protein
MFLKTKKNYRRGAVGAMMDEYERAALELKSLLETISEEDFTCIADPDTTDERCRSIQTVTSHVVGAGFGYANYIREQFSMNFEPIPPAIFSRNEIGEKIAAMLDYTVETLDGRWEMTDEEIGRVKINSRWGPAYDLEQLLEHAIVHILRHRRQIEKFLLKFENETDNLGS